MSAAYTFFLRWLEMRGAAVEQGPDAALVLLPPGLLDLLGFPETLAVTADPDVAAEDGALLLTPGHPALVRLKLRGRVVLALQRGPAVRPGHVRDGPRQDLCAGARHDVPRHALGTEGGVPRRRGPPRRGGGRGAWV